MRLPHQREIPQTVYGRFHRTVDFPRVGSSCLRNVILYDLLEVVLSRWKIDQFTFRRPLMGQTHPDPILAASGYRKLVLTKTYVAIYKLIGDTVYVYAIVNGTTDYPRLLK